MLLGLLYEELLRELPLELLRLTEEEPVLRRITSSLAVVRLLLLDERTALAERTEALRLDPLSMRRAVALLACPLRRVEDAIAVR